MAGMEGFGGILVGIVEIYVLAQMLLLSCVLGVLSVAFVNPIVFPVIRDMFYKQINMVFKSNPICISLYILSMLIAKLDIRFVLPPLNLVIALFVALLGFLLQKSWDVVK